MKKYIKVKINTSYGKETYDKICECLSTSMDPDEHEKRMTIIGDSSPGEFYIKIKSLNELFDEAFVLGQSSEIAISTCKISKPFTCIMLFDSLPETT